MLRRRLDLAVSLAGKVERGSRPGKSTRARNAKLSLSLRGRTVIFEALCAPQVACAAAAAATTTTAERHGSVSNDDDEALRPSLGLVAQTLAPYLSRWEVDALSERVSGGKYAGREQRRRRRRETEPATAGRVWSSFRRRATRGCWPNIVDAKIPVGSETRAVYLERDQHANLLGANRFGARVGLLNVNNTCYISAVLQAITHHRGAPPPQTQSDAHFVCVRDRHRRRIAATRHSHTTS